MTIVSIPAGTPITVEVSHIEVRNKFAAISKELQEIVNKTGVSAMDILTRLSGTDGVAHSEAYFGNVTTEPNYDELKQVGKPFWVLKDTTNLEFDDEQVA